MALEHIRDGNIAEGSTAEQQFVVNELRAAGRALYDLARRGRYLVPPFGLEEPDAAHFHVEHTDETIAEITSTKVTDGEVQDFKNRATTTMPHLVAELGKVHMVMREEGVVLVQNAVYRVESDMRHGLAGLLRFDKPIIPVLLLKTCLKDEVERTFKPASSGVLTSSLFAPEDIAPKRSNITEASLAQATAALPLMPDDARRAFLLSGFFQASAFAIRQILVDPDIHATKSKLADAQHILRASSAR